jgi:hypothetical protein
MQFEISKFQISNEDHRKATRAALGLENIQKSREDVGGLEENAGMPRS